MLVKVLQEQADERRNQILAPIGEVAQAMGVDGVTRSLQMEYARGVRSGILMSADLPRAMVEFLEARVPELRVQAAEESERKEREKH
jgi:hypothetical protein